MRRKAVQEHFKNICDEKHNNQTKFWSTMKPLINSRKHKNRERIVLKVNDSIVSDQKQVAEELNNFFSSSVQVNADQNGQKIDLNHIASKFSNVPTLTIKKTDPTEVKKVLNSINPKKATGCDLIPPRVVQQSAEVLCYPFATLFNYVLDAGKVPRQWKFGEITPLYKKDKDLERSNYRPITILPSFSKVFEKIVNNNISPHFESIYHKYVFAYRKHHGCDAALLSLTENWKMELDNHKVVGLIMMDLSKAFDKLPHDLLISKLKVYGADDKTANLIKDYLSNRRQRVKIGSSHSDWQNIEMGVPQGSILGPLLFNIFMNDLAYVIKESTLSAYADDTQIFYADKDPKKVEEVINKDLERIDKWYIENQMIRNHSKYQAMVMGRREEDLYFRCENTVIPNVTEVEMLGVILDEKLKFDQHVSKVCRKVTQKIAVLRRMRNMLPFELRKAIYNSFITPHYNYCAETWHFCSKSSLNKLEKVNERAIRFVFKDKNTPYCDLLKQLGRATLAEERAHKILGTIFKILHGSCPVSIRDLIQCRISAYNLRGKDILKLPKVNTTKYGLKSWRYYGPKLWNSLPDSVKSLTTYAAFRKALVNIELEL